MHTYLVGYDLTAPGRDDARVSEAIKSYDKCAKVLESVWLITSSKSADEVRNHLKRCVDSNDKLLVVHVTKTWATSNVGDRRVTEWMFDNIS
jgi:hypothetical protein